MPSQTHCPCTNNPFIHFVYGNHNLMARSGWNSAKQYFREGMLALPYGAKP